MKTARQLSSEITAFVEKMWEEMRGCGETEKFRDTFTLEFNVNAKVKKLLNDICEEYNNRNKHYCLDYDIAEYHSEGFMEKNEIWFRIDEIVVDVDDDFYEFEIEDDEVIDE